MPSTTQKYSCRICHHSTTQSPLVGREMMFGTKAAFDYFTCANCGCVQIATFPSDMTPYYQGDYYSFGQEQSIAEKYASPLRAIPARMRSRYAIFDQPLLGKLIYKRSPRPDLRSLHYLRPTPRTTFLDVGCGNGSLLFHMAEIGFTQLTGIDPFLEKDIAYENGVRVLARPLSAIEGQWEVVMMHHVFEHVPDPQETLALVRDRLAADGRCLIRIPLAGSYAWQQYGTDWVQMDAPRHFHLFTEKSFRLLAESAGFAVVHVAYDSSAFQFWGSEQYRRDVPLFAEHSYNVNLAKSGFSRRQIVKFEKMARKLNQQHSGDQAAFYLAKR